MFFINIINALILFFAALLFYQLFLASSIKEGLTTAPQTQYQPYDTNNPNNALILAQQNAGNINVLDNQINKLISLQQTVQTNTNDIAALQKQVNQMVASQASYAQSVTGTKSS